jgi:hypothetical protein
MVLISIYPYTTKRFFLFVATLVCLFSVSSFAESAYLKVDSTPYDRQMTRIASVLFSRTAGSNQSLSLTLVNHWMEDLRAIPYGFSPEWKTPVEVESGSVADCKGKAVALYEKMHAHGADHVRLVIGKRTALSRKTHAWLEWNTDSGTYVLDPTINWSACRADRVGDRAYIPLYAYAGNYKYRASSTALYAKN